MVLTTEVCSHMRMVEAVSWIRYPVRSQEKNECGILCSQTLYKKEQELPQTSFLEISTKILNDHEKEGLDGQAI